MKNTEGATKVVNELQRVLDSLVGLSIENVDNPIGSVLRLDIGPMAPHPIDGPDGDPHGWRHLTIQCPWRILSSNEVLCDWTDPGGAKGVLRERISVLKTLKVEAAAAPSPAYDLNLEFSGGYRLFAFSDVEENRPEAWFILGGDGIRVTVAPRRGNEGGWNHDRLVPSD